MTISARYRDIVHELNHLLGIFPPIAGQEDGRAFGQLEKAAAILAEQDELVGEIPQFRLEKELTPVLLKAHAALDRGRLILEERGETERAAAVWEIEQRIYRLLNDL